MKISAEGACYNRQVHTFDCTTTREMRKQEQAIASDDRAHCRLQMDVRVVPDGGGGLTGVADELLGSWRTIGAVMTRVAS